jgi:hypothetical protein
MGLGPGRADLSVTPIALKSVSDSPYTWAFETPDLNRDGVVAFYDVVESGVYVGDGGPLTPIALQGVGCDDVYNSPSINYRGEVAFHVLSMDYKSQIWLTGGSTPIAAAGQPIMSQPGAIFLGASPSDWGEVNWIGRAAIHGTYQPAEGDPREGIFRSEGGQVRLIADAWDVYTYFESPPRINAWGHVAFAAYYNPNYDEGGGVFLFDGEDVITLVDDRRFTYRHVALNNWGDVAYLEAQINGNLVKLKALIDGRSRTIAWADPTRLPLGTLGRPALNDRGQVAFTAEHVDEGVGLYLWERGKTTRLLGVGDTLPNLGTVSAMALEELIALNNNGQIAFVALINDGTEDQWGVFRLDLD